MSSVLIMGAATLFLDRDGVINRKMPEGDYVKRISEFEFLPGVFEALAILSKRYDRILVVSNQRGISKGLLSEEQLQDIHAYMQKTIRAHGGRIDKIYYCPHEMDSCDCRKPKIGMALQARADFPDIDFQNAIVLGDSASDLVFGKNIGARAYLVHDGFSLLDFARSQLDQATNSLRKS